MLNNSFEKVIQILREHDSDLPDINFDIASENSSIDAYEIIKKRAKHLVSQNAYYWSLSKNIEVPILFSDNPAIKLCEGEAETFHVLFGGLTSNSGDPIPDLGVFIFTHNKISLDYRMGNDWNINAVEGLFEIMLELEQLSQNTLITHTSNIYDRDGKILLSGFDYWKKIQCQEVSFKTLEALNVDGIGKVKIKLLKDNQF